MRLIHCLNNISKHGTDLLDPAKYALTDNLEDAEGILVRSAAMHDMKFPAGLRAIARAGAGVNNIPLDRCAEEGIVVFNTPGANANAVKEIIICSLLLGSRGILDGIEWCREHADDENIAKAAEKVKKQFAGQEIKGKKLGVIGLGAVGAEVANAAVELGMDVYGYDPFVSVSAAWKISSPVHHITDLADIFRTCDYITIHVPALKDTVGMIDAHTCSLMKEGVVLLNFSRETLVDTAALSVVLDSGRVKMYITDFATPEVMKLKNTVVMPHLGASTAEAEDNCAIMAVREMVDYFENGNITNSVNYPACDMGVCPAGMTRLAMLHANVPNMIGQITNVLGEDNVNIANLMNKARGNHAYTLIDLDQPASDEAMAKIRAIEGVRRVRMI
ncbi:MAG: phosphoglycerate dehydrogenase [Eggerthellaceae bacterium]